MLSLGFTVNAASSESYTLAAWLFLRLLGLIYLAAFSSLAIQIKGLAGPGGISPAAELLRGRAHWGNARFYRLPTLCWFNAGDAFLSRLAWAGAGLSVLLVIGFAPMPALILLWIFYLSLLTVCGVFLGYQWDVLLLETGFLAILLAPLEILPRFPPVSAPPPIALWLLWWLLFRLMFSSGVAKLRSGDRTWRNLAALCYHYETQPLPTPLAWYAHQLPLPFHRLSAALMFAIEIGAPFLIFAPPHWRHWAAASFILLMVLIQLTGNYCFFNLLAVALSLLLLDDRFLLPVFRAAFPGAGVWQVAVASPARNWLALGVAVPILVLSLEPVLRLFRILIRWPGPVAGFFEWLAPFRLVSSYGLFSIMTTERPEIIIEGSHDRVNWQPYEFKWKPGDVKRAPGFVAPHQPRLDWQMWFAAIGQYRNHPWLARFLRRLLEGSPAVLALLKTNPFPDAPPRYVRAIIYDYRFSNRAERRANGAWWQRERRGSYSPIIELRR